MREGLGDVVTASAAQTRSGQRLLEAQRPTVESTHTALPVVAFVITSVHVPLASRSLERRQRHLRVKRGEERRLPFWIGVVALSSNIVSVKFAVLTPFPTPLNNGTET